MFCNGCYGHFLNSAVDAGPDCVDTRCPQHKCKVVVPHSAQHKFLSEEKFKKFKSYLVSRYIDAHPKFRFCPAPGCSKIAVGSGVTHVDCSCSLPFCFRCGEEVHDPASCDQVAEWKVKCTNESETANWILANTKKCPKCAARIEKNQGCNHMTCKICKHDFCWICLQPWQDHGGGYYKCNRFVSKEEVGAQKAKAELERYLHYYQRYHNHDQAMQLAKTTHLPSAEKRMQDMLNTGHRWPDVLYLKQAMEQIIKCRRVLKYTYVLGYCLQSNTDLEKTRKELYEDHQSLLELKTDTLHEKMERPVAGADEKKALETKNEVVNLTRVTSTLLENLLNYMKDMYRDMVLNQDTEALMDV